MSEDIKQKEKAAIELADTLDKYIEYIVDYGVSAGDYIKSQVMNMSPEHIDDMIFFLNEIRKITEEVSTHIADVSKCNDMSGYKKYESSINTKEMMEASRRMKIRNNKIDNITDVD